MAQLTRLDEIFLDLRGLFPPEPMERVLDALSAMALDQQVRMLIDREPLPLYRILERNGYPYRVALPEAGVFEITIGQAG
jgi:hypothetical protein